MNMKYYTKLKSYLTTANRCFIPKCKAICCTNAPLPEDFLPKHKDKIQRQIYRGLNIGQNDIHDTFNSVIYNTTPNPIQLVGFDQYGNKLFGIPKEILEELQIKSAKQINEIMDTYKDFPNYCPFISEQGKCSVYKQRPQICKDFGTLPDKINICPDKSSKLDVIKFHIKNLFNFKGLFKSSKK